MAETNNSTTPTIDLKWELYGIASSLQGVLALLELDEEGSFAYDENRDVVLHRLVLDAMRQSRKLAEATA
jgi:hypothetical protein